MNLKICYLKIDVSCEVSVNFISHLTKCHAWHATCTLSPPDADRAIHKKHAKRTVWSAAPATQNDDEDLQSVAPVNSSSENDANLPQKKQHVMKHVDVEMSQSATPATRNEATRRLKPPKAIALQNSPQAQSYYSHDGRSRTLANGWRPSGHVSTPKPPK
jgi:hypothetical protein